MATRYWVGGSGSWTDTAHWSTSSGGAGGASVPLSTDDVVIDHGTGSASVGITITIGTETCNNFTVDGSFSSGFWAIKGNDTVLFNGTSLTVNGQFNVNGGVVTTYDNILVIASANRGTTFSISAATVSISHMCFRDIAASGAATWSGTRIGDMGNNSGITFTTPSTLYHLNTANNVNATGFIYTAEWSTSSGGSAAGYIPLPQDTCVIDNVYAASAMGSFAVLSGYCGGTLDFSSRTNALDLFGSGSTSVIYGSVIFSSSVTTSGTLNLAGRGSTTVTTNAATSMNINVDTFSGTVTLQDTFNANSNITLTSGTFTTNNQTITSARFVSSNTNARTLNLGSTTWTITGGGSTAWNAATSTNFTLNVGTSTILFTGTAQTFAGGGLTYNIVTIGSSSGATTFTITGSNNFSSLNFPRLLATYNLTSGTTQTVSGTFTSNGTSGNTIKIRAVTAGSEASISAAITSLSYVDVKDNHALGAAILFDDSVGGVNSGNNTNWCFSGDCSTQFPTYNPSIISAVARVQQGLSFPKFIFGGKGGSGGTLFQLFKKSATYTFATWESAVYKIGQPFRIKSIALSLATPLTSGQTIIPFLHFDNNSDSATGTTINSTNYPNEQSVTLTPDNFSNKVYGINSFFLELRFRGSSRAAVTLPIFIEVEKLE